MSTRSVAALVIMGILVGVPAVADEGGATWKTFKGKILVSDEPFKTSYDSDAKMIAGFRKQSKPVVKGADSWTLNLMVFLSQPPEADSINIVYYDVSAKPREQVNFSEVGVQKDQHIVNVNGVAIAKELGFVKGHKFEVLATRIIGGKEKVYARGSFTLK